jgi:hypothetical protein
MKKTPREWMLDRERDVLPRLDSIRKAALSPEQASFVETVQEIFRPCRPAWTALLLAWIALAAAHIAVSSGARCPTMKPGARQDLTTLTLTHDEALSFLDYHS